MIMRQRSLYLDGSRTDSVCECRFMGIHLPTFTLTSCGDRHNCKLNVNF